MVRRSLILVVSGLMLFGLVSVRAPLAYADFSVGCDPDLPTRVSDLITAIGSAVTAGGAQIVNLSAGCVYTLIAVNNGAGVNTNGLPVINNSVDLTINGNEATITRDPTKPRFRFFQIAAGATLRLNELALTNGYTPDGLPDQSDPGQSGGDGGAIHNSGTLFVNSSVLQGNQTGAGNKSNVPSGLAGSGGKGGAIYTAVSATVTTSVIDSNKTGAGGDAYPEGTDGARGSGGGIYNGGTLTVTDTTLRANEGGVGGGIESFLAGAYVYSSTFENNKAVIGGGLSNYNLGNAQITNSTFSGNTASAEGGALWSDGTLSLIFVTIAGNSAPASEGGGVYVEAGTTYFSATLLAGNTPGDNCSTSAGAIVDVAYNLDDGTTCGFSVVNNSLPNTNPVLDTFGLQDNGGPTWTIALLAASPARNHIPPVSGGCPQQIFVDQRGVTRPQETGCDIGAYEYQATTALNVAGVKALARAGENVIKWRTTNESAIAGFRVARRFGESKWQKLSRLLDAKHAGDAAGAKYHLTDSLVRAGKVYRYKVQVIYLDGHREWTDVVVTQAK